MCCHALHCKFAVDMIKNRFNELLNIKVCTNILNTISLVIQNHIFFVPKMLKMYIFTLRPAVYAVIFLDLGIKKICFQYFRDKKEQF